MQILYLLKFKNKKHFKFGVTHQVGRLYKLDEDYSIDLTKQEFFYSEIPGAIKAVENIIKLSWREIYGEYEGKTGWTEVKEMKDFRSIKAEVKRHTERLQLKHLKYEQLLTYLEKIRSLNKLERKAEKLVKKFQIKKGYIFTYNDKHYYFENKDTELILHQIKVLKEEKKVEHITKYLVEDFNPLGATKKESLYLFKDKKFYREIELFEDKIEYSDLYMKHLVEEEI